jgi:flavin reductase (DIM6/NTAB) family NADH-FMN oxidoreductase RutF
MRRLTSTVSILATSEDDQHIGMVVTSVSSLCLTPPSIVASVAHTASMFHPLIRKCKFTVNVLRLEHEELVGVFAGKIKGSERFNYGNWAYRDGLPYLIDSQATLFCTLDASLNYADHEIVIGRVDALQVADEIAPLLWQDGKAAYSMVRSP